MLCQDGGVYKKIFKTKYLVFEYAIINKKAKIVKFHYLNVYNLVGYSGKTPITMQIKKNIWYNIRPESVKKWYCSTKTPKLFIDRIIECINKCPHIEDKINIITNITAQFESLKSTQKSNKLIPVSEPITIPQIVIPEKPLSYRQRLIENIGIETIREKERKVQTVPVCELIPQVVIPEKPLSYRQRLIEKVKKERLSRIATKERKAQAVPVC
jgi:hypothetical protein